MKKIDVSKIPVNILGDIIANRFGADHNGNLTEDERQELEQSSPEELLNNWLNWHGIFNWGDNILYTYKSLQTAAVKEQTREPDDQPNPKHTPFPWSVTTGQYVYNVTGGEAEKRKIILTGNREIHAAEDHANMKLVEDIPRMIQILNALEDTAYTLLYGTPDERTMDFLRMEHKAALNLLCEHGVHEVGVGV